MENEESVGRLISQTFSRMKHSLGKELSPHQVTTEQWSLLKKLTLGDNISQTELSKRSFKDQPTTARILNKLEQRGLICRMTHPDDKRAFLVCLTPEGRAVTARLQILVNAHMEAYLTGVTEEEQQLLVAILKKIHSNLDQGA